MQAKSLCLLFLGIPVVSSALASEALAKAVRGESKDKHQPLTPFQWCIAFALYMLGAAVTGQLSLVAALSHKACRFHI